MALDYLKLIKEEKERLRKQSLKPVTSPTLSEVLLVNPSEKATLDVEELGAIGDHDDGVVPMLCISSPLENYRVDSKYNSLYYISDIITKEYANFLLSSVNKAQSRWIELKTRKLQLYGKLPLNQHQTVGPNYDEIIPPWLSQLLEESAKTGIFSQEIYPNNVLINQYEADQGILHHTDGPSYHNRVAIFSLESACVMSFKPKLSPSQIGILSDGDVLSVVLQPRSLLIFSDDLYNHHMHGIYPNESVQTVGQRGDCVNLLPSGYSKDDKVRTNKILFFHYLKYYFLFIDNSFTKDVDYSPESESRRVIK
jgi:alkylated DNA repair protein alkB family protein 6